MERLYNIDKTLQFEIYSKDSEVKVSWDEANQYCKELGIGWRLPTIDELKIIHSGLYKLGKGNFKASFYWSSDILGVNYRAYFLNFESGTSNNGDKSGPAYAIAVRTI